MSEAGLMIPEDRWFTNLHTKGNTGSASIFIMLEEALNGGASSLVTDATHGSRIRPIHGFVRPAHVCGRSGRGQPALGASVQVRRSQPVVEIAPQKLLGALAGRGTRIGVGGVRTPTDAPSRLSPASKPTKRPSTTTDSLLRNLRQQVMEGARWITRAASSLSVEHTELRAEFIHHAAEEQRDFRMLERDYVAVGGSARGNPVCAKECRLGGPFGLHVPGGDQARSPPPSWGDVHHRRTRSAESGALGRLARVTSSTSAPEQITFLRYHGGADEEHTKLMFGLFGSPIITPEVARQIVKTAKVVARLYALQLEELDNA